MTSFWHTQIGPHLDGDPRQDGQRCIGEVVCPDCDNVLVRFYDEPGGVSLYAWVPASSPSLPGSRRTGWTLYAPVGDDEPSDAEGSILNCWRGHGSLWITGADCRAVIQRYRVRSKKVRHPASRAPDDVPS